jgi:NTE family protein
MAFTSVVNGLNQETRTQKTALVLSGGGSRGAYEIGVWQGLREMGIAIDIVTGTSVGALNGAVIVQNQFELALDLWSSLETTVMALDAPTPFTREIWVRDGTAYTSLKNILDAHIDEDIIRNSPMDYGIVTVELGTFRSLNLFKEDIPAGQLVDYMLASSACFPALKYYEIDHIKYIDGAYADNMPIGMAIERGATNVIAVDLNSIGLLPNKRKFDDLPFVKVVGCEWDLGNILVFDKKNARRIMRLGYLDVMKAFNAYDGKAYCFIAGDMDKRILTSAESAGRIFDLSPELIYSRDVYNNRLAEACTTYIKETEDEISEAARELKKWRPFGIANLLKRLNAKTLTILIAQQSKQDSNLKNLLAGKAVKALFKKESEAAAYLIRAGLI